MICVSSEFFIKLPISLLPVGNINVEPVPLETVGRNLTTDSAVTSINSAKFILILDLLVPCGRVALSTTKRLIRPVLSLNCIISPCATNSAALALNPLHSIYLYPLVPENVYSVTALVSE